MYTMCKTYGIQTTRGMAWMGGGGYSGDWATMEDGKKRTRERVSSVLPLMSPSSTPDFTPSLDCLDDSAKNIHMTIKHTGG